MYPVLQRIHQLDRSGFSDIRPHRFRIAVYFRFDGIQFTDAYQRFGGGIRECADVYILDFSSGVRHTCRFLFTTVPIQRVISTIGIRMQVTTVTGKVSLWMLPCDPASTQTRPLVGALNPRCVHLVYKLTAGPCAFCRCPSPAPDQGHPLYKPSLALTRTFVADRKAAPAVRWPYRSTDPAWHYSALRPGGCIYRTDSMRHVFRELRREYVRQQPGSRVAALYGFKGMEA